MAFDYNKTYMGIRVETDAKSDIDYRVKRFFSMTKITRGTLVDVGSGAGAVTEQLAKLAPQCSVSGCDISRAAIERTKHLKGRRATYKKIPANGVLPYRSNSTDTVTVFDVLEHVPNPRVFLQEIKRILKPKGTLFLVVPCENEMFTYTWFFRKIGFGSKLTYSYWGHIQPDFTHTRVRKLLFSVGFIEKDVRYSEHILYQLLNVLTYFLPNEILHRILGKQAEKYTDAGIVRHDKETTRTHQMLLIARKALLQITKLLGVLRTCELELLQHYPVGAWKMIISVEKKK